MKAAEVNCPKRLYDSLSSFPNQDSGGILVFGMDERKGFDINGEYDAQDLQKHVTEICGHALLQRKLIGTGREYSRSR